MSFLPFAFRAFSYVTSCGWKSDACGGAGWGTDGGGLFDHTYTCKFFVGNRERSHPRPKPSILVHIEVMTLEWETVS